MIKIRIKILILVSFLLWLTVYNINSVKALEMIYIGSDGSIEGTNKISQVDDTYTFNDDIFGSIIVDKDNIVLDGAGYTLEYLQKSQGLIVNGKAVTIKGIIVTQTESNSTLGTGIYLNRTSYCVITNNTIIGNSIGVMVFQSERIRISDNNVTNNRNGIFLNYHDSTIIRNHITGNQRGIHFLDYGGNTVTKNKIENNNVGIDCLALSSLVSTSTNLIYQNNFVNNTFHFSSWAMMAFPLEGVFEKNSVGNFWSNYNGTDSDGDGIGDTPHILDSKNQDNYPLMQPLEIQIIPEFPSLALLSISIIVTSVGIILRKEIKKKGRVE